MAKYFYPVILEPEEVGYSVYVPDIKGCATQGENMEDVFEMVQEAIGLMLENVEEKNYPVPSNPEDIKLAGKQFVIMVPFDSLAYEQKYNSKPVKKTLSIPAWLNTLAEENHINFSHLLKTALCDKLQVKVN
ncbi:MAG: type II toxin-antitoxin system HicB family antitoxin [Acidaminococcaceae bacterium]|nr:type II toxin-antitoxin system HicB family antitoxin [Acidaminococcaceae bacterium]MDO4935107.1 type II toxin-antitoxin system HicB family antitoxin [Phascolarctobacterium sp.]